MDSGTSKGPSKGAPALGQNFLPFLEFKVLQTQSQAEGNSGWTTGFPTLAYEDKFYISSNSHYLF